MANLYRKKPVVIEAMLYTGENMFEIVNWIGSASTYRLSPRLLNIHTLEGDMTVNEGDWVIRGVQGEFYPCKPDIFDATYEEVRPKERGLDG